MCKAHGKTFQPPTAGEARAAVRRRRRLWELEPTVLCPVIGVCFTVEEMRQHVQAVGLPRQLDDFQIHTSAITACRQRCELSRRLQKVLDKRHDVEVRAWAKTRGASALTDRWAASLDGDALPASLWAALTHVDCNDGLQHRIYADIHLIQHQRAASRRRQTRIDIAERTALENARTEIATLQRERAELLAERHTKVAQLQQQLDDAALREKDLQHRLEQASPQVVEKLRLSLSRTLAERDAMALKANALERMLERQNSACVQESTPEDDRRQADSPVSPAVMNDNPGADFDQSRTRVDRTIEATSNPVPAVRLAGKRVLCVGGRPAMVPRYKALCERHGARFEHHDGGVEQALHRLDDCLKSAELVLCHSACVSHAAYWRVKRHCRLTGKRCVYLESTGVSCVVAALGR